MALSSSVVEKSVNLIDTAIADRKASGALDDLDRSGGRLGGEDKRTRSAFEALIRKNPTAFTIALFWGLAFAFALVLLLPFSSSEGLWTPFDHALFTSASAISGTGLGIYSNAVYWSGFGKVMLTLEMQLGSVGVMTITSMVAFAVSKRLGLTQKILASDDLRASRGIDPHNLLRTVLRTMAVVQAFTFVALFVRLLMRSTPVFSAFTHSVFYTVSAFANCGFDLTQDGFSSYASDFWVTTPLLLCAMIGAIGFPVILNIIKSTRRAHPIKGLNVHTKVTIITTSALALVSALWFFFVEWNNNALFVGAENNGLWERLNSLFFASQMPRLSGFGNIRIEDLHASTEGINDIMMFIGGGSGGTTGGIKVSTFAVLLLALWAEMKARDSLQVFKREIAPKVLRMAVGVIVISLAVVFVGVILCSFLTSGIPFNSLLFEVISAYATTGLSTAVPFASSSALTILFTILMVFGRIGPATILATLSLRHKAQVIKYPQDNIIVG